MLQALPYPIRVECPPGACDCKRETLTPESDYRILFLTREEEKKLIARIDAIASYDELKRICARLHEQLGLTLRLTPSVNEVRTARGITVALDELPGLCRKTRQAIPSAVRRCLERHPDIVYAILDAEGLFGA